MLNRVSGARATTAPEPSARQIALERAIALIEQHEPALGADHHPVLEKSRDIVDALGVVAQMRVQLSPEDAAKLLASADACRAGHEVDVAILELVPRTQRLPLVAAQCNMHVNQTLGIRAPDRAGGQGYALSRGEAMHLNDAVDRVRSTPDSSNDDKSDSQLSGSLRGRCAAARTLKAGKSEEFAMLAYEYLAMRGAPVEGVAAEREGGEAHQMVVAGRRESPGEDPTAGLPPTSEWNAEAILIDPHGNKLFTGHEIQTHLDRLTADRTD